MTTQDENPVVKLVKKSVGLPTGKSSCCSVPAVAAVEEQPAASAEAGCCGSQAASESSVGNCCEAEKPASSQSA